MNEYYTSERNVQIVLSLLKAHNIRKVVVSPGSTNIAVVGSMEHDSFFEMYSVVDERSAAYVACGLSAESGEPVVLSCTGATASRNFYPGLTEAYYRKLPVLALTSSQDFRKLGHLKDQITDRRFPPRDVVRLSEFIQTVRDDMDEWDDTIKVNRALLELHHHGGGPVHLNIETTYDRTFEVKQYPTAKAIYRFSLADKLPELPKGQIGIFIGAHHRMKQELQNTVDAFCESNNAVVFCEPSSGYSGKYGVYYTLASYQDIKDKIENIDVLIHIGEVSGFIWQCPNAKEVWRVSEDGELRDLLHKLHYVFEMPEELFFRHYIQAGIKDTRLFDKCSSLCKNVANKIPELPFSNIWIAQQLHNKLPKSSEVQLGILAPVRSWNFFGLPSDIDSDCNQGGFGIDGNLSTLIGASLVHKDKIYFGVVGDLSFFYDLNSLGNRHVGNNIRILLINNGLGCEFRLFNQVGDILGEETDKYISAGGHYGNKSKKLVRDYVEDLGFTYMTAASKDEFLSLMPNFIAPEITEKPIVFEVFTKVEDENDALKKMSFIHEVPTISPLKMAAHKVLGEKGVKVIKSIIKRY